MQMISMTSQRHSLLHSGEMTMNLLLDTHVVIWAFIDDPGLSQRARQAIIDGHNTVFVSAVTAWEISIKKSLGKLEAPDNYTEELTRHRFLSLDVTTPHALAVEHLPHHHHDPFDRLLVAQAQLEGFTLVTRDKRIQKYDISILVA